MKQLFRYLCLFDLAFSLAVPSLSAADKRIVLIAGTPSHGPGEHEFNAGCLLLKKCLDKVAGIEATVHLNGWPHDPHAFDHADAVLLYMDGGSGHIALKDDHLEVLRNLVKRGV